MQNTTFDLSLRRWFYRYNMLVLLYIHCYYTDRPYISKALLIKSINGQMGVFLTSDHTYSKNTRGANKWYINSFNCSYKCNFWLWEKRSEQFILIFDPFYVRLKASPLNPSELEGGGRWMRGLIFHTFGCTPIIIFDGGGQVVLRLHCLGPYYTL